MRCTVTGSSDHNFKVGEPEANARQELGLEVHVERVCIEGLRSRDLHVDLPRVEIIHSMIAVDSVRCYTVVSSCIAKIEANRVSFFSS